MITCCECSLVSHLRVAILHLLEDPSLERLSDHSGANIDEPLSWDLSEVDVIWEVALHLGIALAEIKDLLDG